MLLAPKYQLERCIQLISSAGKKLFDNTTKSFIT